MKKILLAGIVAALVTAVLYAQDASTATTPDAATTPAATTQSSSTTSASSQLATFQQAVQTAETYSRGAHNKLEGSGNDYETMNNQRIFESYQNRLSAQQSVVDQKQSYLDSLVTQKAPTANINQARQAALDALSRYDAIMRDFTAWVASVTASS